jgi:hypothetical protein
MKKFTAIILACALALTLAACDNGEGEGSPFASVSVGDVIQFGRTQAYR